MEGVRLDRVSNDGYKSCRGCVYIRRRYYGILPRVGGELEHSALSPISLSRSVL